MTTENVEKKKPQRRAKKKVVEEKSKPVVVVPSTPPPPQKIKRKFHRRVGGPKPEKMYFHAGTQAAICAYQIATDSKEKHKIYTADIAPAFEKLVENLINIHKFSSLYETYESLKNDCVNFLFETIRKFDPTRGTNAFSYFNVVAKRWLIIRAKYRSAKQKVMLSLDDAHNLTFNDLKLIEETHIVPAQDEILEKASVAGDTIKMLIRVRSIVNTEQELACINSLITVFEHINELDHLTKSSVMLYVKELTGMTNKQLQLAMQSIKNHYLKIKRDDGEQFSGPDISSFGFN